MVQYRRILPTCCPLFAAPLFPYIASHPVHGLRLAPPALFHSEIPGWAPAGEVQVFDAEDLYDLVDGQAEAFFAYAFEQASVGDYENAEGGGLRVEVWQAATRRLRLNVINPIDLLREV